MTLNGAIGGKASWHCTCANARCLNYADNGISEGDVNMGLVGRNKFAAGIGGLLAVLASAKAGVKVPQPQDSSRICDLASSNSRHLLP
jgi:hypothetical protein